MAEYEWMHFRETSRHKPATIAEHKSDISRGKADLNNLWSK